MFYKTHFSQADEYLKGGYFDEERKGETLLELFKPRTVSGATSLDAKVLEPENKWAKSCSVKWLTKFFFFYTSFRFFSSCLRKGHDPDVLHLPAQRQKIRTRERKKADVFKSDTCTLKIPTLMLGESLWGASTCKSRWETHLYFLKTRKGMERGRSIADRTCLLNVTVRWLNRPLWGYYNSRLHTVPALTGSAHATHSTPRAVP